MGKLSSMLRRYELDGLSFEVHDDGNTYITYYNSCQDEYGYPSTAEIPTQELRDFLNGVYTTDFTFKKAPKTVDFALDNA